MHELGYLDVSSYDPGVLSALQQGLAGRVQRGPAGDGATASLISGYHLAFLVGAATISAGIVLAFALLRTRTARDELQLAERPEVDREMQTLNNLDMKREAA